MKGSTMMVMAGILILGGLAAARFWFRGSNERADRVFQEKIRDDCRDYLAQKYGGPNVLPAVDETLNSARVQPGLPGLLAIECVIEKTGTNQCARTLAFLFSGEGASPGGHASPLLAKMKRELPWYELPESIRSEFIANGGSQIVIQLAQSQEAP